MAETLLQRLLPFHAGMGEWPGKLSAEEIVMDANGWRPISEAVKDYGVEILIPEGFNGRNYSIVRWVDNEGWLDEECCVAFNPTHFLPIPPPPAQEVKS